VTAARHLLLRPGFADTIAMGIYARYFKRLFDIVGSVLLLVALSPMLLLIAAIVRLDSPGGVIFRQQRAGYDGRTFELLKFRTMTDMKRAVAGEIFDAGHPDVTRSGAWLRRFKLDELPQLWNVLIGDMSIVGPRPCMPEQVATFNEDGCARLRVRPGLTGLAQVNGNIFLSWPQRWVFDRAYVEHLTLRMDLAILARTVLVVLLGERRAGQT
jgi:undecaprenyl phosphate N,N'-diacetylbacillosamine 1-phosphate transferase